MNKSIGVSTAGQENGLMYRMGQGFRKLLHRTRRGFKRLLQNYELLLFLLPAVTVVILFNYVPMYGVQIAFRDYNPVQGITGSPWAGFKHFERFFNSYNSWTIIKNTVLLSFYSLLWSFPIPIVLSLMLNQLPREGFKRVIQTVTYLPYFISTVVMVGLVFLFLSPERGMYGAIMNMFDVKDITNLTTDPASFRSVYIASAIWQTTGFSSIIYLASLSGVDPSLYEAAIMDGAGRFKRIIHVDIPCLLPTITIMFILAFGNLMNVGFEKTFLMQNQVNLATSEVLATYVYKVGLQSAQYSFSAAVNLFNTVINIILLVVMNTITKKLSQTSLI